MIGSNGRNIFPINEFDKEFAAYKGRTEVKAFHRSGVVRVILPHLSNTRTLPEIMLHESLHPFLPHDSGRDGGGDFAYRHEVTLLESLSTVEAVNNPDSFVAYGLELKGSL